MTEVVGLSPVIGKDFPHFLFLGCYFLTRKQTCKLEFTGFMINNLFDKKHCRQTTASELLQAI